MVVPIGTIVDLSKKCAEYFGLIDSVSADVKKLLHQSFQSAVSNLKYAMNAPTKESAISYLNQAKNEFIRANAVEENENLVSSYVGLAMCQALLGERGNAATTVREMKRIQLSKGRRNRAIAADVASESGGMLFGIGVVARMVGRKGDFELLSERILEEYKKKGVSFIGV